ncbi:MAG: 3'-5' exonuclease [Spirochaetales bacterium]|nr:3'-5' exonuclease [Spirochaetales bacterium]
MYNKKLKELYFTAIDFETTGLYPAADKIVEIGAVKFNLSGEEFRFSGLINPGMKMPKKASEVNGINDSMLEGQPEAEAIFPDFLEFIEGSVLVAHNIGFDAGFLTSTAAFLDLKVSDLPCLDTLHLARQFLVGLASYSLGNIAKAVGINIENAHRAEDDAEACMKIFFECLKKLPGYPELELRQFIKRSGHKTKSLSRNY